MIVFTKRHVEGLIAHALRESSLEACGVIAGTIEGEEKKVVRTYECANVDPDPEVGYEINPSELLRVIEDAEGRGLEIIGFYHSHPMALSRPSMVDELKATWPGHSYVIVSPKNKPVVTSWMWVEGKGFIVEKVLIR